MISTPRAVGIEIARLNTMLDQIFARGPIGLDAARRRNVISRNRVAKHRKHARASDIRNSGRLLRHSVKVWGFTNVGGISLPAVDISRRNLETLPVFITGRNSRI